MWDAGSLNNIDWTASDNVGVDSVNVDFSVHGLGGPWVAVQHEITGSGPTPWTLPSAASDSAAVRVTAFDHALNQGTVESSALFEIHATGTAGVPWLTSAGLSLAAPEPHTRVDGLTFRFALPAPRDAHLDVIDLAGRARELASERHERRLASHSGTAARRAAIARSPALLGATLGAFARAHGQMVRLQ